MKNSATPSICHYSYDLKKKWYVYVYLKHPITGKREQIRFYQGINRFKTKTERLYHAKVLLDAVKQKLKDGWRPHQVEEDDEFVTLVEALQGVTELKWESLRTRTKHTYKVIIGIFYQWLQDYNYQDHEPKEFGYQDAQRYMDYLTSVKKQSGRTWNNYLSFMKIFFSYLVEREIIDKNPFKSIKKQTEVKSTRNYAFADEEFVKLNTYLIEKDKQLYYFNMFIYYLAMRQKEISMLRIKDIDFVNMNIFVNSAISKNRDGGSIVIMKNFMPILKQMNLQSYPPDYYIFSFGCKPGPEYNNSFDKWSVKCKAAIRKLSINENCTQYSYKHTAVIKLYYATNFDIHAVCSHCRHHSILVTEKYMKSLGFKDNKIVRNADI